jgi:hypothetical protein
MEGKSGTVVQMLLATGKVDPDAKDNVGRTPLSVAAGAGSEAMVKLLLDTGKVDPDAKDNDGRTPLNRAAGAGAIAEPVAPSHGHSRPRCERQGRPFWHKVMDRLPDQTATAEVSMVWM